MAVLPFVNSGQLVRESVILFLDFCYYLKYVTSPRRAKGAFSLESRDTQTRDWALLPEQ